MAKAAGAETCAGLGGVSSNSVRQGGVREVTVEIGYAGMLVGSGTSD